MQPIYSKPRVSSTTVDGGTQAPNAPLLGSARTLAPPTSKQSLPSGDSYTMAQPLDTVGRLSYAPATQTTVVTTTTTTTTAFTPFKLKASRNLAARNLEQYPLASTPTPRTIKRLKLECGGRTAFFEEADDPVKTLAKYSEQQARLHVGNEGIVSDEGVMPFPESPRLGNNLGRNAAVNDENQVLRKRSATPISLPDATELQSFHRRNQRAADPYRRRTRNSSITAPGPSPDFSSDNEDFAELASPFESFAAGQTPPLAPRALNGAQPHAFGISDAGATSADSFTSHIGSTSMGAPSSYNGVSGQSSSSRTTRQSTSRSGMPPHIDTSPANDASLPSPSLSPIRAAANLQRKSVLSKTASSASFEKSPDLFLQHQAIPDTPDATQRSQLLGNSALPHHAAQAGISSTTPFSGIPQMIDSFDVMPDEMKTYVMFHLLKRCSKSTLQFVAEVVDPAMRCDYLLRLPLELSLNVLQHLDAPSLCSAAQVSKKWRLIVDSDERAWKALIEKDGFVVSQEETSKAISEGWGWRVGPVSNATSMLTPSKTSSDMRRMQFTTPPDMTGIHMPDGPTKRKYHDNGLEVRSSKRTKRGSRPSSSRATAAHIPGPSFALMELMESAAGPNAIASAAALAMPNPGFGLPSLQNLHFHKSIYQKHHILRQNWMKPKAKPMHLAFKAHQRHVVTCLQFDDDKILTGSDDSFIDVYDTKTGASIRRLVGHEGGVWALEYQGDLLVSGSTDRTVRVWDMRDGRLLHTFQGHTSTVRCLQILQPVKIGEHPDGRPVVMPRYPLIITGSRDSSCRVWRLPKLGDRAMSHSALAGSDTDNPYFLRALFGHSNSVRAIAAHGDTLVSGSYDTFVRVWQISTGECVHRLHGHTSKVYSVVLDNKRNRCISGSMDNMVKVWSLETGTCLFNLAGHSSLVGLLDLRDDALVSAAADATLRVWDPVTGQCKHELTAHTGAITCFLHDGQKIISGSDRALKMWDTRNGELVRDLLTDLSGVWQIKFDERRCIAAVQRDDWTYIEVLDFGLCRDDVPMQYCGRRVIVDGNGRVIGSESTEAEADVEELS